MKRFIDDYNGERFNILIIGGGITGAAVAYEAASRGLSVALVEKSDFGGATSAATSKLIHGGLRYLSNGEIGLVRESLRERRNLENIAPNFVYPIPCLIGTYRGRGLMNGFYVLKAGMTLYDILSFDKGHTWDKSKSLPVCRTLSRDGVIRLEPGIIREGLTGGFLYYDCASLNPERLTLAFIKSALKYGARVANYAMVEDFVFSFENRVSGAVLYDLINRRRLVITANLVINCAGPWADILLDKALKKRSEHRIRRSEGIHLITKKIKVGRLIGARAPNGRHFFLFPWRNHTLIGTTDREYAGDPDEYRVTKESIMDFIGEINSSFGDSNLKYKDIIHAYGGLRPLVEKQVEGTYGSSRKYEIYDNRKDGIDGLITVEGGKYTTSRNLAEMVVNAAGKKMKWKLEKSIIKNKFLYGSEIEDMGSFLESVTGHDAGFSRETLEYLGKNYGTEYEAVLLLAAQDKSLGKQVNEDGEILAEVVYALRYEMAFTLKDIFFRRTGMGTLGYPGDKLVRAVGRIAARELKWDKARLKNEINEVKAVLSLPR